MGTKPPTVAAPGDAAALARELVEEIAAIQTAPPAGADPTASRAASGASSGLSLAAPRAMLENAARFVSPHLPADAPLRPIKAILLRLLRIVTRDQTVFNSALLDAVRSLLLEVERGLSEVSSRAEARNAELRSELEGLLNETGDRLERNLGQEAASRERLGADLVASQRRLDALERDRDIRWEAEARRTEEDALARGALEQRVRVLEGELAQLRLQWTTLRREVREGKSLSAPAFAAPPAALDAGDPLRAGLYADFERAFRGSEEEIRERQSRDVRLFRGAPGPVADLGCGRGELVELLVEAGLEAVGCDANGVMVERAREKGLPVVQADLFVFLRSRPDASLGGITAYQVVEHLQPAALFDLVELALAKLAPGGRLLLETINPESVYAMRWFWMDFTHVRPVPAPSLGQLLSASGFRDVAVDFRSPVPAGDSLGPGADEALGPVARLLFAPQDYAVTGLK